MTELIDLHRIKIAVQFRDQINDEVVAEYMQHLDDLPPVDVFRADADETCYLADGIHRFMAHQQAKRDKIRANVHAGSIKEAIRFAAGANADHGLRRDAGYVRRAIVALLTTDPDTRWTGRELAKTCRCSHTYATDVLRSLNRAPKDKPLNGDGDNAAEPEPSNGEVVEPSDSEPPAITDMAGTAITDPDIAAVFRRRKEIQELMAQVSRIKTAVLAAIDRGDELYALIHPAEFQAQCSNLYRHLKFSLPHTLCPWCGSAGCKVCHNRGWVNAQTYEHFVPEDLKA